MLTICLTMLRQHTVQLIQFQNKSAIIHHTNHSTTSANILLAYKFPDWQHIVGFQYLNDIVNALLAGNDWHQVR